jgi:hypothetical protein
MRATQLAVCSVRIVGIALLMAGSAVGIALGAASAAGTRTGPAGPAASLTFPGTLSGIVATSASNAWAVGISGRNALIEHWNGRTWRPVRSPRFAGTSILNDVAAASARSAWAVGDTGINTATPKSLIEHWNGKAWTRVASPPAGHLAGVAVSSARSAWAVGDEAGRAGCRVVPRLPSRARCRRGARAASVCLQAGIDGVADFAFQSAAGFGRRLAFS